MVIFLFALVVILLGPKLLGWSLLEVLTGSMDPNIPVDSLITVDTSVKAKDLEPGDVVVLALGDGLHVTHRLMENLEDQEILITKGDNNNIVDSPAHYSRFVGKVVMSVPKLGHLASNFASKENIPYVMGFLIVFVLLIFVPEIFKKES